MESTFLCGVICFDSIAGGLRADRCLVLLVVMTRRCSAHCLALSIPAIIIQQGKGAEMFGL